MATSTCSPDLNALPWALCQGTTSLYSVSGLGPFVIFLIVISTLSIAIRFWARYLSPGTNFGLDDGFALAALPLSLATQAVNLDLLNHGLGKHTEDVLRTQPWNLEYNFKSFYGAQLIWVLGTSFIRFSTLAFYARIFHPRTNPSQLWRLFYWAVVALSIAWTLFAILFDALSCQPVQAFWDLSLSSSAKCLNMYTVFVTGSAGILVVDLSILLVPLPQVLKLSIRLHKRIAIAVSLMLGYVVPFMSLGRIVMAVQIGDAVDEDPMFFLIPYLYWSMAEIALSIVAVCLPAMFQLFRRSQHMGVNSLFRKQSQYVRTGSKPRRDQKKMETANLHEWGEPSWDNLYDGKAFTTTITAGAPLSPTHYNMGGSFDPGGINVRQEVHLITRDVK